MKYAMFTKESARRRMTREEAYGLYANSAHEVAVHGFSHLALAEAEQSVAR